MTAGIVLLCGLAGLALIPGEKAADTGVAVASAPASTAQALVSSTPIRTVEPPAARPPATKLATTATPASAPSAALPAENAPDVVSAPVSSPSTAVTELAAATPDTSQPPAAAMTPADPDNSTTADAETAVKSARIGDLAVNVHAGPSNGAQKLFVAQPGQSIQIREVQGGWVHIVTSDGASGWVYSRYIAGGLG